MPGYKIPFINLKRQYQNLRDEILDAVDEVYMSGISLDGPKIKEFETAIATRCNRGHAIALNSATQALSLTLMAQGDTNRVMVPSLSFIATANSVSMTGRDLVFADVDYQGLLDINKIDHHMQTSNISALVFVNLFGNMVDQDSLATFTEMFSPNLFVIEDAAQSFGAKWRGRPSGSFGDASILSFDPMKNLPNYGSGGMVLTDNNNLAMALYSLRNNGKASDHLLMGTNSRMSEADAATMLVKLKYFDEWQERRSNIAEYYDERLADYVDLPQVNPNVECAWHKYVIQTMDRDPLKQFLAERGVETRVHYDRALPEYDSCYAPESPVARYKNASKLTQTVLSLPIYPEMTDSEVEEVADTVISYWRDF